MPHIVGIEKGEEVAHRPVGAGLRAAETPPLVRRITLIRRSLAASCRMMASVSSVDPSSTTISSKSRYDWASTLSTVSRIVREAL